MKLGIMQPYIFPYIGYFQIINAVDTYVLYDDVQFIKGGWINRNNILIGGKKVLFTLPLTGASTNKDINEVELVGDFSKFEKTLTMAYAKAPYFKLVSELVHRICTYNEKNLARFAGNSIMQISEYIGIQTQFVYSSALQKDNNLKAQDKVIEICKELHADTYINSIGGKDLYDKDAFQQENITLQLLQPSLEEYKQFQNEFVPGLSILDVLMFNPVEKVQHMLLKYELR